MAVRATLRPLVVGLVCLSWLGSAVAEPVEGEVRDSQSQAPVPGALVRDVGSGQETTTDDFGRFRFADLAPGPREMRVQALGYAAAADEIEVAEGGGATDVVLLLVPSQATGEIIEVTGERARVPTAPGRQELDRTEIAVLPGTRSDALQSLKSLPGVAAVEAAGGGPGPGLVIRGSAPEDSKGNIDGIEVPILYHFFGFQSVLPTELIDGIEYLPGGFGVEEGRSTGGVINVTTRPGRATEMSGHAEVSFVNVSGFVEGPIGDSGKLHYSLGFRRSLIDAILPLAVPDDSGLTFTTAPRYYDGQARIDWLATERDRFTVFAILSNDLLTLISEEFDPNEPLASGKFDNETGFYRVMTSWVRDGENIDGRSIVSIGQDSLRFEVGSERYLRLDGIRLETRTDWSFAASKWLGFRAGGDTRLATGQVDSLFPVPPAEGFGGQFNFSLAEPVRRNETTTDNLAGAYVATDVHPTEATTITAGLRADYFARFSSGTLSPRVALEHDITDRVTGRGAIGHYTRPANGPEALSTDLDPERATQYVLGSDVRVLEGVTASLSGFYTDLRQLVTQDPTLAQMDPADAYVNTGSGRTFGLEALVRVRRSDFFGWLAYTISRSDRVDGPSESRRLFDYDQTHNIVMLASYKLGKWRFGGRWQLATGIPSTPVVGSIYQSDLNIYVPVLGELNSERLPTAHQLDVRIDREFRFDNWDLSVYLDITNVYAHPKVLAYQYNFDFSERGEITDLPIVPALGVRGSF